MKVEGSVHDELKAAAQFFAARLMDGRVHRHITIEIEVDANFGWAGSVVIDDDRPKPKFFTIKINPMAHDHVLQCLAHEMVHVAQYATGRLFDLSGGKVLWEGKPYQGTVAYGEDGLGSEEFPWEEEAYALEEELFEDWLSIEVED